MHTLGSSAVDIRVSDQTHVANIVKIDKLLDLLSLVKTVCVLGERNSFLFMDEKVGLMFFTLKIFKNKKGTLGPRGSSNFGSFLLYKLGPSL